MQLLLYLYSEIEAEEIFKSYFDCNMLVAAMQFLNYKWKTLRAPKTSWRYANKVREKSFAGEIDNT